MPKQKDLKRLVRARMQKTGESYTAARAQLVKKRAPKAATPKATPAADLAEKAGMSDASVAKATGKNWKQWVAALDAKGAQTLAHGKIAALLHAEFAVPDWWAQMVTVGYERIRGLREKGQRRGGGYDVSKSKTYPVSLAELWPAFEQRERWLGRARPTVRTTHPSKTARWKWEDGTTVAIGFTAKGAAKCQLALQHGRFATRAQADEMRAWWAERLEALGELLGE